MDKLITHLGYNDKDIKVFEGLYPVPEGMSYNTYIINDEKIAICDTVDRSVTAKWLADIERELAGRTPDYLIVHHVEPDHSYGIGELLKLYPDMVVVGNTKTFPMLENFYGEVPHKLIVGNGDTLTLGVCSLNFTFAPMVHWPEVMVSYEPHTRTLFAADAFGKFGISDGGDWLDEARRYYYNIVGKYGVQAGRAVDKLATLDIRTICPLHGPVLSGDDVELAMDKYALWTKWGAEERGVVIAAAGAHGNTLGVAHKLAQLLTERGVTAKVFDLATVDSSYVIAESFKYDKLVFASATYYNEIFPTAENFLRMLLSKGYTNRKVSIIENGSWAPQVGRKVLDMIEQTKAKNLDTSSPIIKIVSSMSEANLLELATLADELSK